MKLPCRCVRGLTVSVHQRPLRMARAAIRCNAYETSNLADGFPFRHLPTLTQGYTRLGERQSIRGTSGNAECRARARSGRRSAICSSMRPGSGGFFIAPTFRGSQSRRRAVGESAPHASAPAAFHVQQSSGRGLRVVLTVRHSGARHRAQRSGSVTVGRSEQPDRTHHTRPQKPRL